MFWEIRIIILIYYLTSYRWNRTRDLGSFVAFPSYMVASLVYFQVVFIQMIDLTIFENIIINS